MNNDRGVSPVIGIVLLLGFTVFMGIGLFLFTQGLIMSEGPREDADFELQYTSNDTFNLLYVNGDDFDSTNTHELYLLGETPDGDEIDKTMLYEEGNATNSPDGLTTLSEGMRALTNDDIQIEGEDGSLPEGSALQVVWEPADQEGTQFIIDELVIPDESTIEQIIVQEGEFGGSVSINVST